MSRREAALRYIDEQNDFMKSSVEGNIEANRKGYAALEFCLPDGTKVKSIKFKAEQKSHDFNFGCNMFLLDEFETGEKNKTYREIFPKLFNYAVAPFYWDALEPEKGKARYGKNSPKVYRRPAPDLVIEYCKEHNIRLKGHCLVYDAFHPDWMPDDPADAKREIRKHLTEIANKYCNDIYDWDIVNEMLGWSVYGSCGVRLTKLFQSEDYVRYPFEIARTLPFDRKFINEGSQVWSEFRFERSHYYLYLKDLMHDNIKFDGVGIQCHQFVPREKEDNFAAVAYNPRRTYDFLDTYAKLGKPLHISEVTIASYNGDAEDMDIQAEIAENMYKVWFSHKAVDAIVYWNLADGYTWVSGGKDDYDPNAGENKFGGALLYHDLTPKPAFKALEKLINQEWHTSGVFETNTDSGIGIFKGFKGMYDIEFEYGGKIYKKDFHLDGRDDFVKKIVID